MAADNNPLDAMPVIRDIKDFARGSGNRLERLIFNHRIWMVAFCCIVTVLLGHQATKLSVNAGFEKMLPQGHPYIQNYLQNQSELRGLGNAVRVVVENVDGDIFDQRYLELLRRVNDELFLTPGVDRAWMKSLWTPAVRWTEVTEEGFTGGPVMPDAYDGSPQSVEELRLNIARSGIVGQLVANDFKSSMIFVPLIDTNPQTGERLDYPMLSQMLEENVRARFEQAGAEEQLRVRIHIVGFAKLVGDLIDGLSQVMSFFVAAALIVLGLIYAYTRCVRSTLIVLGCSIVAVIWQLGIVSKLGFELDPYSVLVPFLIFAIAVSHGAQKMNGIMQDIGRGTHKLVAARYTFRRLFLAGLSALLCDAVGFAVLMVIDIPVIKDLALTASVGIAVLVVTNLLLLPVLLSYTGVSPAAAQRSLKVGQKESTSRGMGALWSLLDRFTERRWATGAIAFAVVLTAGGLWVSQYLKIGDLDAGAPELRPDSRYNRDNAFVTSNYALSSDLFAVIVKTPIEGCLEYQNLVEADRLAWELQQLPGVQTTTSLVNAVRQITAGSYEGSVKWMTISRNQDILNYGAQQAAVNNPDLFNGDCSVMPVIAYLADHKAETLDRVVETAAAFAEKHSREDLQFLLAAGNAGVEAATNIVVRKAWWEMLILVYAAVALFCLLTFRSWRAVVVAIVPLMMTSILCEALMVVLGIGVKVATLPVIALGVGIGVDYALYLISVQLAQQKQGLPLTEAYRRAVQFTGKVVGLIGVTLAAGVITWAFSPIKFQADMGILLTFMFVWNMLGALILIPALSHFLMPTVGTEIRSSVPPGNLPDDAPQGGQRIQSHTPNYSPAVLKSADSHANGSRLTKRISQ
ncbi:MULTISPECIES: efflux RND transporter permease subunit [Pseudomonas aeruginosa group]|uniref:MMPL family transporter n=1 Tax=Pseudomonas nitroreducens TaxID=46680 RepID=A0A6G6IT56_PSENT|nr:MULTISPECIES: MMPL family transporter [Pseudomonas aeruginosa group]KYO75110.1 MMPL family protein [Pseudomonas aeruginosa]QIE86000.1 MMPL family transporter [Pseudomonas nitroreducens]HCE6396349.1 MMPL family transporter [Pseudomonas aeruginosa]